MDRKKLGVIGTGKLGLCMALLFEEAGYEVIGVDVNPDYVAALNDKHFHSAEKGVNEALQAARHFRSTTDMAEVLRDDIDSLLVIVPTTTPSEMIYTYVAAEQVIADLRAHGRRKKPVDFIMVSTTPPGYCDRLATQLGALNYRVVYHPEFIAQGTIMENLRRPDILLLGRAQDHDTTELETTLHAICENNPKVHAMTPISAELTKLSLNCFLTMKIAFANSVGDLALQVGGEHEKVLAAIADDKRIEPLYLKYGFGYGGPCLPRDNQALNSFAMQTGAPLYLSAATDQSNKAHLLFQKAQYLKHYDPSEPIVFESVTYKGETDLIERSQPLALARMLAEEGRRVVIRDRAVVIEQVKKEYPNLFEFETLEATAPAI